MSIHLPPEALDEWLAAAAAELGIADAAADAPIGRILEVAADVAHGVARPAAPLSTFLLGLALGGARVEGGSGETLDELAGRLTALAARWQPDAEG